VKSSISVSKEDYLKAILEAESEGQTVISATLLTGLLCLRLPFRWRFAG